MSGELSVGKDNQERRRQVCGCCAASLIQSKGWTIRKGASSLLTAATISFQFQTFQYCKTNQSWYIIQFHINRLIIDLVNFHRKLSSFVHLWSEMTGQVLEELLLLRFFLLLCWLGFSLQMQQLSWARWKSKQVIYIFIWICGSFCVCICYCFFVCFTFCIVLHLCLLSL